MEGGGGGHWGEGEREGCGRGRRVAAARVTAARVAEAPVAVAQAPHAHARVVAAAERDARLERPTEARRQADGTQRAHRRGVARHDAARPEADLAGNSVRGWG